MSIFSFLRSLRFSYEEKENIDIDVLKTGSNLMTTLN